MNYLNRHQSPIEIVSSIVYKQLGVKKCYVWFLGTPMHNARDTTQAHLHSELYSLNNRLNAIFRL